MYFNLHTWLGNSGIQKLKKIISFSDERSSSFYKDDRIMENPKLVQGLEETRLNCRRSRSSGKRKHPSKTSPTRQEFTSKQTVGNGLLWVSTFIFFFQ